jgi:hypothetical protein
MSVQDIPRTSPNQKTALAPALDHPAIIAAESSAINVETVALALVFSIALVTHAFNMFNYPLYRQDEGIVSQQAWSFLQNQQLSPYTFTYEHPPFSTFMLAAWTLITAGFHTFGPAINSGRVLMLVLHLGSVYFLFRTTRQLTNSVSGALVAGLFFTLSPLAVNFQRLLVVDNFMVFWLLASVYFIVCNRGRLFYFFLGSLALGLAVLCRETAIFFVPAFLLMTWRFSDPYHRLYAVWGSALIGGIASFQFILYALFKNEFLPDNLNYLAELAGKATHVSLTGTFYQNYHNVTPVWQGNPQFESILQNWLATDSLLLYAGIGCAFLNLLFGFKYKESWLVPLFGLGYGCFIALGGVDAEYMIVALVPFLAIGIGQTVSSINRLFGKLIGFGLVVTLTVLISYLYIVNNQVIYTAMVNNSYAQVLSWVKGNIPPDRSMIVTDALWVDLHDNYKGPAYPLAHSHWKAARDPAINYGVFKGDYKQVDFLILTEEMRNQFQAKGEELPQQALTNSSLIRQYEGTDPIQIRKINNSKTLLETSALDDSYSYFKSRFMNQGGKLVNGNGQSSAELQADAMNIALFNDDQRAFDSAWVWTAYNLQMDNSLMRVDADLPANRSLTAVDAYSNSRVDTDIALALLLADKRWHDANYTKEAAYIIKSIWENEVVEINKKPYLKATALKSGQLNDQILLNLGAFSPQAYRLFAEVDSKHNWMGLYDSGYALLRKAAWYGRGDYQGIGLPPGLVVIDTQTEELRSTTGDFGQRLGDLDGEAQQALWRVALDYEWYQSDQARDYIQSTGWFLIKYWQKWQALPGQFTNNGLPVEKTESSGIYAVTSAQASILDELDIAQKKANGLPAELGGSSAATEILARAFMGSFYHKDNLGYWQNKDSAETQYWSWMATAFHMNRLTLVPPVPASPDSTLNVNRL